MRSLLPNRLRCTLTIIVILGCTSSPLHAESPFAGTWKLSVVSAEQEITAWLAKIEEKEGKPEIKLISTGPSFFQNAKVETVRVVDNSLHFTIQAAGRKFHFVLHVPAEKTSPRKLLGSVESGGPMDFVQLEESELKELDPKKSIVASPVRSELVKAFRTADAKEKQTALRDLIDKHAGTLVAYAAEIELATSLAREAAKEADVRTEADKAIKLAAAYGPKMQQQATLNVARQLLGTSKAPALAVDYARQAEKMLTESSPPAQQVSVLKVVRSALRKTENKAELKELQGRIARLDAVLDEEFARTAVPFNPKRYPGRKAESDRVVLLELFTGAQCPPCVAADVAFDALLKTYKPGELVLLQYHLHIPGPDPLTNADSEKGSRLYQVNSTPSLFINGKKGPPVGGLKQHSQDRYDTLVKALNEQLETSPTAKLSLTATRKDDKIDIQAEATDVKEKDDPVHLRLVLVEETAHFPGRNGQRLHHNVVRAFPGTVEGLAVKDGAAKQNVQISLKELEKSLADYLDKYAEKRKTEFDDRPIALKKLKVIAFLQNTKSKEVLQAAQVDLAE